MEIPWILISILIALVVFGILMIVLKRKKKSKPDYYGFFLIGIIWLPVGIATNNLMFSAIGIIFLAIGLANRKQWKKRDWKKLSKKDKKKRMLVMAALGILIILMMVMLLIAR